LPTTAATILLLLLLHRFNGLFSRTTWVSPHQKGKPFSILLERETMGWPWHQLNHMQIICTSLQIDNHASTSPLKFLQAGCPSCRPTNSVKALKAGSHLSKTWLTLRQFHIFTANSRQILLPFFYLFLTTHTETAKSWFKKTLLVLGTRRACSVHAEVPEGGRVVVGSG